MFWLLPGAETVAVLAHVVNCVKKEAHRDR
jgi:hypothetical protein